MVTPIAEGKEMVQTARIVKLEASFMLILDTDKWDRVKKKSKIERLLDLTTYLLHVLNVCLHVHKTGIRFCISHI